MSRRVTASGGFAWVSGNVDLGDGVELYPGVVVGEPAESLDPEHRASRRLISIGANTHLREHVVVQRGHERDTWIGENCYIMHGVHVAHDVVIGEGTVVSPYAVLGGHVTVMEKSNIGIGAMIHQWVTIGAFAMVGMGAVVVDDVPPGVTVAGNPARIIGRNTRGLERCDVDQRRLELADLEFEWLREGRRRRLCRPKE